MDKAHHVRLLETCKDAKCYIMLCGYRQTDGHDLYDNKLGVGLSENPWHHYTLTELVKSCQSKATKDIATETIWVNYPLPDSARYFINMKAEKAGASDFLKTYCVNEKSPCIQKMEALQSIQIEREGAA